MARLLLRIKPFQFLKPSRRLPSDKEVRVTIAGSIESVCQAKGCWMTLRDSSSAQEVFVKFKDYAFFVPKNASGHHAVIEGILTLDETPVDELRHYAEDEGKSDEEIAAIKEPRIELKMMADGVIIQN